MLYIINFFIDLSAAGGAVVDWRIGFFEIDMRRVKD